MNPIGLVTYTSQCLAGLRR